MLNHKLTSGLEAMQLGEYSQVGTTCRIFIKAMPLRHNLYHPD